MRVRIHTLAVVFVLGCLLYPHTSCGETVYLDADFNDKEINQVIGTGGAALHEPFWLDETAGGYVRSTPFPTPSLEIEDGNPSSWANVWFKFLDGVEIGEGYVVVAFTLWISEPAGGHAHVATIRQGAGGGFVFVELEFHDDLSVRLSDPDGSVGTIGQYEMNKAFPVAVAIDMTAHTYDVWLDNQLVRDDEPMAVTDETIGYVIFSAGPDGDTSGRFNVDDIIVTDDPDAVPVQSCTWGRIRSLFR